VKDVLEDAAKAGGRIEAQRPAPSGPSQHQQPSPSITQTSSGSGDGALGEVGAWLQTFKLEAYASAFAEKGVETMEFMRLYIGKSDAELEEELQLSSFIKPTAHRAMFKKRLNELPPL